MSLMECARDPCFDILLIGGKEIGRCMQEKGHKGSHQCTVQWDKKVVLSTLEDMR